MWWNRVIPAHGRAGYIISDHGIPRTSLLAVAGLAAAALVFAAGRVDPNNPTGTHGLIVIDKIGRHVRFLDPTNFQEISSLEVGVAPHDRRHFARSQNRLRSGLRRWRLWQESSSGPHHRDHRSGTRKVAGTIEVSPYQAPHGIQIDDAGTIYVTCDLSRKLLVIDPKSAQYRSSPRYRRHGSLGRGFAGCEQGVRRE